MKSVSLFSGIGGFDLGFQRAGIECAAVCEIDKNAQSVLRRRFPNAELFDDVRKVGKETHGRNTIDIICGGFPCQDVSIAGRRAGLAGERSGLWFEFARIIDEIEPRWVVIENVPGLLSSNEGKDFAVIVQWLAQRGYGVAWRVLDAQFFGVPQRRRRVFIVASFGNGSATEVLFESEGGERDNPKGGETGKEVAYSLRANASHSGDKGDGGINTTMVTAFMAGQGAKAGGLGASQTLSPTLKGAGSGTNQVPTIAQTLTSGGNGHRGHQDPVNQTIVPVIWHNHQQDGSIRMQEDGTAPTVSRQWGTGGNNVPFVGVRRLMPIECERLQGFPDGWTDGQSDSARYRQLGNAVAVPVVEWIGKRIVKAETRLTQPAPDKWDSARFTSSFHASAFGVISSTIHPAHLRVKQTVGRKPESRGNLPNKVFCKDCPCFSYSSIPHCNLEHKVILVKDCYVSNECELEFINAGGWQFRPTKRGPDLKLRAEKI